MKSDDANAIADYLKEGGRIIKVEETVPVRAQEILDYLAALGLTAKYHPGDSKPYAHNHRRYSIDGLVRLANEHRQAEKHPPFALREDSACRP